MSLHKCYALGCKKTIDKSASMCEKHWPLVPSEIQIKVQAASIAMNAGAMSGRRKWIEAMDAAREAVGKR